MGVSIRLMHKRAFTLIELLVVVSIIAVLMSILVPALARAREQGKNVYCLNNLRQMTIMAAIYTQDYNGYYPIAYYTTSTPSQAIDYCWDFTIVNTLVSTTVEPGILWQGEIIEKIQQCPSFKGSSNTPNDPYTGYNYNISYIGHGQFEFIPTPAKANQVTRPANCALFGDGQWSDGANKFMRAPFRNPGDQTFNDRYAGTQGYRHHGNRNTNVAWCDGHISSLKEIYTNIQPTSQQDEIAPSTGFLSADNSAYDLK